jgi:hypothetical protein
VYVELLRDVARDVALEGADGDQLLPSPTSRAGAAGVSAMLSKAPGTLNVASSPRASS